MRTNVFLDFNLIVRSRRNASDLAISRAGRHIQAYEIAASNTVCFTVRANIHTCHVCSND